MGQAGTPYPFNLQESPPYTPLHPPLPYAQQEPETPAVEVISRLLTGARLLKPQGITPAGTWTPLTSIYLDFLLGSLNWRDEATSGGLSPALHVSRPVTQVSSHWSTITCTLLLLQVLFKCLLHEGSPFFFSTCTELAKMIVTIMNEDNSLFLV